MSYVIHVWEGPLPNTLEEADQILDRLLDDKQVMARPRLEAFARQLWNRWPRDVGNASVDPVWSDTSLSSPHDGSPLLQFGVVSAHLDEVVPFVAATAAAHGLVVYDPQYGTVYLPQGALLGIRPPPPRPAGDADPMTRPQAIRAIQAALKPVLAPLGFNWMPSGDNGHFGKAFVGGEHRINVYVETRREGAVAFIYACSHLQAIDAEMTRAGLVSAGFAVALALISLHKLVTLRMPQMQSRFRFHVDDKFIFARHDGVAAIAKDLAEVVEQGLLPMLGRYEGLQDFWDDARAFHAAAVPRPGWPEPALNAAIVAGKLLGDARHLELAQRERVRLSEVLGTLRDESMRRGAEWNLRKFREFMDALSLA